MSSVFKIIKLKDITTKIGSGATPKGGKNSYKKSGISQIRSLNIYDLNFHYNNLAFIDDEQAKKLSNVIVSKDDVLLNITGASVARCCKVPKNILPARVNQHVSIVRVEKTKANPDFIQYALVSPKYKISLLQVAQGGATREALTKLDIENFEISIPPLPTQQKIASILLAYDNLIENNTRRIQILEEIAQRIYKEWFVDFKYPGHENDKLVDSELGMIPKEWEAKKLSEMFSFSNGYAFYKDGYAENGKIVVDLGNITIDRKFKLTGKDKYIDDELYYIKAAFHLDKNDIIVAMTDMTQAMGILGKVAIIDESEKYILNQRVGRLRPIENNYDSMFIFASLSDDRFVNTMKLLAKGAVQKYFNTNDITDYLVIKPKQVLIDKFIQLYKPFIIKRLNLERQNKNLCQTRDLLLPKLISGKVDVSDLDIDTSILDD